MATFVADVGRRVLNVAARGGQITRMCVSPEAEKVILGALTTAPCPADVDYIPELRIHGVPVRVYEMVPVGQVWWVIKGGKQ